MEKMLLRLLWKWLRISFNFNGLMCAYISWFQTFAATFRNLLKVTLVIESCMVVMISYSLVFSFPLCDLNWANQNSYSRRHIYPWSSNGCCVLPLLIPPKLAQDWFASMVQLHLLITLGRDHGSTCIFELNPLILDSSASELSHSIFRVPLSS